MRIEPPRHRGGRAVLALGLGAVTTLALPPLHGVPLLWLTLPGLVWLIAAARTVRGAAFGVGLPFGAGFFGLGLVWVANALLVDGWTFGWLIPLAIPGLGLGLGLFLALVAALTRLAGRGDGRVTLPMILVFTAAWVLLAWVRSWLLTGFPWNLMATVWTPWPPMLQPLAILGPYGLGAVTVAVAALPALFTGPARRAFAVTLGGLLLLAGLAGWGWARIPAGPAPVVPGVTLKLVQPNLDQGTKWQPAHRAAYARTVVALTRAHTAPGDVVIWPEAALPALLDRDPYAQPLMASAIPPGGLLLAGMLRATPRDQPALRVWNSLVALDAEGTLLARADKQHLVPFGEYVPLRRWIPLEKIAHGSTDLTPGTGPRRLTVPGLPPAQPLVCYEAIFPAEVRTHAAGARWLLNVTNDSWYGWSAGPFEHFAAARLRPVETGLPLVRAANTGISAVVDPYGRVVARLGLQQQGVLTAPLPEPLATPPLYARWGDGPWLMVLGVMLGIGVWRGRRTPA